MVVINITQAVMCVTKNKKPVKKNDVYCTVHIHVTFIDIQLLTVISPFTCPSNTKRAAQTGLFLIIGCWIQHSSDKDMIALLLKWQSVAGICTVLSITEGFRHIQLSTETNHG